MSRHLRLIIFDCDGTLVDSQHMIVAAMAEAFAGHGRGGPPREAVLGIIGLSLPQAIARLAPAESAAGIGSLTEAFKAAFGRLREAPDAREPLYGGARAAIEALAGDEPVLLGLATGKSRRGVDRVLGGHGLIAHFSTVQTADMAPSKPHPAMIEQAMGEVGVGPGETVMIGDTSFDMEMARRAGVLALGAGWGYHPVRRLERAGAHHVATDFADLLEVLEARGMTEQAVI